MKFNPLLSLHLISKLYIASVLFYRIFLLAAQHTSCKFLFFRDILANANLCMHILVYVDDYMAFSHEIHTTNSLRVLTGEAKLPHDARFKVVRHEGSCSRDMSQRHLAATKICVVHTEGHVARSVAGTCSRDKSLRVN